MAQFKDELPQKLYEVINKAGIATTKQILTISSWDIKKLTNLKTNDISLLKNIAAQYSFKPGVLTGEQLFKKNYPRVTTGCIQIDNSLNGGLRSGTITEVYGESGSGKTQLCINATVHNWKTGVVYICTEDLFPVKRFDQMKQSLPEYNSNTDYGRKIFVEHLTEQSELMSCVRVRLPKLINAHRPSLVIIDSIAAPFRFDTTNYIQRANDLREVAMKLLEISKSLNVAVLCVNQVTASFTSTDEEVIPTLGLAWSNMVSTRIHLKKTSEFFYGNNLDKSRELDKLQIRELSVIFAPDLPQVKVQFVITSSGMKSI